MMLTQFQATKSYDRGRAGGSLDLSRRLLLHSAAAAMLSYSARWSAAAKLLAAVALASLPGLARAEQHLTVGLDKTARFTASAEGVTRLSVDGDRIRKLVHGDSAFETMNDEETGDVFFRYAGDEGKLVAETGHLITESGATIAYEITPKVSGDAETVVISIKGQRMPAKSDASGSSAGAAGQDDAEPFLDPGATETSGGASDGLVSFAREMIVKHIGRKPAPKLGNGAAVTSDHSGAFRARILVASGGASGRVLRPQDNQGAHVRAVWVEKTNLQPNERAWVLIVEDAK
jgi:hypothetical protein